MKKGFTAIELVIGLTCVTILGIILVSAAASLNVDARPIAEEWANDMGVKYKGITCSSRDSDMDGYVSCSVRAESGEILAIECQYGFLHKSCKMAQPKVKINVNRGFAESTY